MVNVGSARLIFILSDGNLGTKAVAPQAWSALREADFIYARSTDDTVIAEIAAAGLPLCITDTGNVDQLAEHLVTESIDRRIVWIGSRTKDVSLRIACVEVARRRSVRQCIMLVPSQVPAAVQFQDLVEVVDTLRSPGGCPWDGRQTLRSLVPFLIEETYELAEAVEADDRAGLVEELGDLLMQVVFLTLVAGADTTPGVSIEAVVEGIVSKLVRRQPQVFAEGAAPLEAKDWESIKKREKPHRRGVFDGIPRGMPTIERAYKMLDRLDQRGLTDTARRYIETGLESDSDDVGMRLLAEVQRAQSMRIDPGAALREALGSLEVHVDMDGRHPAGAHRGSR
jgi:XTP/dITP diphosphohydrolase